MGPVKRRGAEMQLFVKLPSGVSTRSTTIVLEVDASDTILDVKAGGYDNNTGAAGRKSGVPLYTRKRLSLRGIMITTSRTAIGA